MHFSAINFTKMLMRELIVYFFLLGVDPYCEDKMPKECMNLITRDKEYCKTRPEFMKKNCARTCEYCGMMNTTYKDETKT